VILEVDLGDDLKDLGWEAARASETRCRKAKAALSMGSVTVFSCAADNTSTCQSQSAH